jgi:peptidoglycan/LPS O-acetylase OafA/YrhL
MDALIVAAAPAQHGTVSWEVVLGVASLVVLAGGVTAAIKRSIRPTQALGVVGVAVAMGAIVAFASYLPVAAFRVVAIVCLAAAGIAMAVNIVTRPLPRIR